MLRLEQGLKQRIVQSMKWTPAAIRRALRCYILLDVGSLRREELNAVAEQIAGAGATIVQLRDKHGSDAAVVATAQALRPIFAAAGIPLILNDRWHLVNDSGADGVHLGQEDGNIAEVRACLGAEAIIGRSIDSPADCQAGHDYFGLGPIFSTATKQDAGPVVGLAQLRGWRAQIPGPLVAIGGMSIERAPAVIAAGADGIAALSAVCNATDPAQACRGLRAAVDAALEQKGS